MNYPVQNDHSRPQRRANEYLQPEERYARSSANSQMSQSPGHWKKYIAHEDLLRKPSHNSNTEFRPYGSPQRSEVSNYKNEPSHYKTQNARKDEMMRRVKEIQNRVMPILKSDTHRRV